MFAQISFRGPAENLESRLVTVWEHERALEEERLVVHSFPLPPQTGTQGSPFPPANNDFSQQAGVVPNAFSPAPLLRDSCNLEPPAIVAPA